MVKIGSVKNSQLELKTVAGWLQFRWVRGNSRTALLFPSNHLSCLQPSAVLVLEGKVAGSSEADVGIKVPPHRGSKPLLNPCSDGTSDGVAVFLSFFFYQFAAWGLGCFQTQTTQSHSHPCWWTGRLRWSRVGHYPTWRVEENPLCPQPGAAGIFCNWEARGNAPPQSPRPSSFLTHTHTHTWGLQRRMWAVGTLPTDPSSWPFGLPQTWLWVTSCPIPACGHLHWWSPQEARRRGSHVLFGDKGAASHKQKGCIAFAFRIAEQKRELHPCIKKDIVYWF